MIKKIVWRSRGLKNQPLETERRYNGIFIFL